MLVGVYLGPDGLLPLQICRKWELLTHYCYLHFIQAQTLTNKQYGAIIIKGFWRDSQLLLAALLRNPPQSFLLGIKQMLNTNAIILLSWYVKLCVFCWLLLFVIGKKRTNVTGFNYIINRPSVAWAALQDGFYHAPNVSQTMVMWPPCWKVTDTH